MNQRDYATNSTETNRQLKKQMAGAYEGYQMSHFSKSIHRKESFNLLQRQQKALEHNFNKQSGQLKGYKKLKISTLISDHGSSKGSLKQSNHSKNVTKFNASFQIENNAKTQLNQNKKTLSRVNKITAKQFASINKDPPTKKLEPELSLKKFQFRFFSFISETTIAYCITIGLFYLIKATNFPFFLLLLIFGLMYSISPWSPTNLMMLIACAIVIANYFLNVQVLTYPSIVICYLSVLLINEKSIIKIMFIGVVVFFVIWGFIAIPELYSQFAINNNTQGFYFVFPILVFLLRIFLYSCYRCIRETQYLYLQLPFFLSGLEYGIMMTLSVSSVQFWYLMILFTLQISNDRSQFILRVLIKIWKSLQPNGPKKRKNSEIHHPVDHKSQDQNNLKAPNLKIIQRNLAILPAHASGYNCLHSFHIVCIVYVLTKLPLYSPPYSSYPTLFIYIYAQWYKPLVIWALMLVYQVMCLVLDRKRRYILLIGFPDNGVRSTIVRGFMLAIGFWFFYLGLAIGNYCIETTK